MGEPENRLTVGVLGPVQSLDPREAQDFQSALVLRQIYETPYAPPFADDPPEPLVFATPLVREADEDGLPVWSATLRPGLAFSDGVAVTPHHVAHALQRATAFTEQARAEVRGDRVVFVLARPQARFEVALTQPHCAVVRHEGGAFVGTGPYVPAAGASAPSVTDGLFTEGLATEGLHLVRNPYYRDPVAIAEIEVRVYPPDAEGRPTALVEATRAGEVDFTNALSREDLAQLRGVRKWFEPGCSTALLYFNTARPHLAAAGVRRALALALSRTQLARISYSNALAFRASGILPPMMGTWRDGVHQDVGRARALLARHRRELPSRWTLLRVWGPRPYLPHPRLVSEAIAVQLAEVGVTVDLEAAESSADFARRAREGDYDLVLAGWIAETPDPADFLESVLASQRVPRPDEPMANRANYGRYADAEMDRALAAFRADPSPAHRDAVFRRVREEIPVLPLMYGPNVVAHSWRLRNFRLSPLGIPFFHRMRL